MASRLLLLYLLNLKIIFAACIAFLISSCMVSDRISFEDSEGRIPEDFFSNIKKDKTTAAWVNLQLGPPQLVQSGPDGLELLTYQLMRDRVRNANFLFLFRFSSVEEDIEYLHLLMYRDIVHKYWLDRHQDVDLSRVFSPIDTKKLKKKMMKKKGRQSKGNMENKEQKKETMENAV